MLSFALSGVLEIADSASLVLDLVDTDLESHIFMALESGRPETVINLHFGELNRSDLFQTALFLARARDNDNG